MACSLQSSPVRALGTMHARLPYVIRVSAICNSGTFPLCSGCLMKPVCGPAEGQAPHPSSLLGVHRKVKRGLALYRAGDACNTIFFVLTGSAKVRLSDEVGREQILDFPLSGDLFGFDGLENGIHICDAVALEDMQVCAISVKALMLRCREHEPTQRMLNRLMMHEFERGQRLVLVLGRMASEKRVVWFLLDMSKRMAANGYSARQFNLRMTREDIAQHLGMTVETVSRTFTKLNDLKVLTVHHRHIEIMDFSGLQALLAT